VDRYAGSEFVGNLGRAGRAGGGRGGGVGFLNWRFFMGGRGRGKKM